MSEVIYVAILLLIALQETPQPQTQTHPEHIPHIDLGTDDLDRLFVPLDELLPIPLTGVSSANMEK